MLKERSERLVDDEYIYLIELISNSFKCLSVICYKTSYDF